MIRHIHHIINGIILFPRIVSTIILSPKSLRLIVSSTRLLLVLFSFVRNVATFLLVLFLFFKFIYSHGFVRYTRLASSSSFSQRSAVFSALPLARATFPGSRHDGEIDQRFMLDALSTIARDNDASNGSRNGRRSVVGKLHYIISREAESEGKEPGNVG